MFFLLRVGETGGESGDVLTDVPMYHDGMFCCRNLVSYKPWGYGEFQWNATPIPLHQEIRPALLSPYPGVALWGDPMLSLDFHQMHQILTFFFNAAKKKGGKMEDGHDF